MSAWCIEPGTIINGYEFLEKIGSGGFSQVYRVKSMKFNEIFAGKVITLKDSDLHAKATFQSETTALLQLDHPHIIRLYDRFTIEHKFFLILEYCPNGSLWEYIKRNGPLKGPQYLNMVADICSAISFARKMGIAHRDVKPQNILLDRFMRVKLADFGISFAYGGSECSDFRCSAAFAPPEVLQKHRYNPIQADVWSLGVTILALGIGSIPWKARTQAEMVAAVCAGSYTIPTNIPTVIKALVKRMMILNPDERINMEEFEHTDYYVKMKELGSQKKHVRSCVSNGSVPQIGMFCVKALMGPSQFNSGVKQTTVKNDTRRKSAYTVNAKLSTFM